MTPSRAAFVAAALLAALLCACGGGDKTDSPLRGQLNVTSTAAAFARAETVAPSPSGSPAPTATPSGAPRVCDDPGAAARVRPSTVRIEAGQGVGTGVIVSADLVITAEHVVSGVQTVKLTLADGRTVNANVLAKRPAQDLAVIRVSATGLTPATWGDDRALRPGQPLLALGFALDIPGEPSLTGGRFSAHRVEDGVDLVQTDAPLNHGNSGGPIFTQCGEVVAIVSFGLIEAQGLNFGVAARHARELAANPTAGPPSSGSPAPRSPSPSVSPGRSPSPSPTSSPTASPAPSRSPSPSTSPAPNRSPSATPSATPRPSASARPTTPQALYQALLDAPVTASELPSGFSGPRVSPGDPGDGPNQFRAIGQVDIELRGPDAADAILYIVYPTVADARGRFDRAGPTGDSTLTGSFTPPGFSAPAKCLTGNSTVGGRRVGVTVCIALVENVEVWGISQSATDTQTGNDESAIALAQAGIAHLQRVK